MDINETVIEVCAINAEKGWTMKFEDTPEKIALMHSELSESLEEYRKGKTFDDFHPDNTEETIFHYTVKGKPEGIGIEMVDCIIRIMHYFGGNRLDLAAMLRAKIDYNKTRSFRYGNKII